MLYDRRFSRCQQSKLAKWWTSWIGKMWSFWKWLASVFREFQRLQYCTTIDFWHQVIQDGRHDGHLVRNLICMITRKVLVRSPWNFTWVIDCLRGRSPLIFGMLGSKMAITAAILDRENMKFQNLLHFWLQGIPEASVLHNNQFLASRDPRWSPRWPSCRNLVCAMAWKVLVWLSWSFTWFIDRLRGQSLFVSGMLESKMAAFWRQS